MRILLDACLPVRFRHDLASAGTVQTARFAGLSRLENGALLSAMEGSFDVLITMDRGIRYQQSIAGRSVSVLILRAPSNALDDLRPLVPAILAALTTIAPGMVVEV